MNIDNINNLSETQQNILRLMSQAKSVKINDKYLDETRRKLNALDQAIINDDIYHIDDVHDITRDLADESFVSIERVIHHWIADLAPDFLNGQRVYKILTDFNDFGDVWTSEVDAIVFLNRFGGDNKDNEHDIKRFICSICYLTETDASYLIPITE